MASAPSRALLPTISFDARYDNSLYSSRYGVEGLPKDKFPEKSMPATVAYSAIHDLRQLDHNPRLNMASFCTTFMEPEAEKLILESLNVNIVDMDEYPSCTEIHNRCVALLCDLYHAPNPKEPTGAGCVGSSEAVMLAGLAMKKQWQNRRKAEGKPYDKPNIVMGYNVQVVWEKFTRYFEVEERLVPIDETCFVNTPERSREYIDENTIGVVAILGSTYNGEFEDVQGFNDLVDEIRKEKGWEVPVHVDAASGGFVAPFIYPELLWDFRLPNVKSINISGHKYGLVYPGIGWVVWREKKDLPDELVFHINYLGCDQASVTLNFSKGASHVVAQYYQLLRLGFEGYRRIMSNLRVIVKFLEKELEDTGRFEIVNKDVGVPLVACRLKPAIKADGSEDPLLYDEFELADKLRESGWVVPAYSMAPNAKHVKVFRVVIREDHSMTLIQELLKTMKHAVEFLDEFHRNVNAKHLIIQRFKPHRVQGNPLRATKHNTQC